MAKQKDAVQTKPKEPELAFDKEIARLPEDMKKKLKQKEELIKPIVKAIEDRVKEKAMGFYLMPEIEVKNNMPIPNFDKLTLHFLLDDFERPVQFFDPKLLFEHDFSKFLIEEKKQDQMGQPYSHFALKADSNIVFRGTSISLLRETCFDSVYDELKRLGSSFVYKDNRGFISALKTIDIHRNMLLQKFEKYIVVYAGAGSWLRGEKSNDFDVFVVVDDTDVKRMPRMQVKDQLTRIIWQMSNEVAALTGIQIHIQVYLLTDFWEALKDAHPVMFTFLRDGVPFYDRGLYSAWKELLKLGKIRPSPEAIDMHMNVANQLVDRAKKTLADIMMSDVYYAALNPAQAILMLKGYNPTTPKETVRMFKEVLLAKEKCVSKKDVEVLESAVKMFKEIEHNKEMEVKGEDIDKMLKELDSFLTNIKKLFEEITEERTKESIVSSYNELLVQMKTLPLLKNVAEDGVVAAFEKNYVKTMPSFVKDSLKNILKAKSEYEKGKISTTEVNKVLKEIRNVLAEIKEYRDKNIIQEINRRKLIFQYADKKSAELLRIAGEIYLLDVSGDKLYVYKNKAFVESDEKRETLSDNSKLERLSIDEALVSAAKLVLKTEEFFL